MCLCEIQGNVGYREFTACSAPVHNQLFVWSAGCAISLWLPENIATVLKRITILFWPNISVNSVVPTVTLSINHLHFDIVHKPVNICLLALPGVLASSHLSHGGSMLRIGIGLLTWLTRGGSGELCCGGVSHDFYV